MRVQNNVMAMNAYRNYTNNSSALSKNLEKLSSGYAINRAGDDAAGLSISEKMRAEITALDRAQDNAQDGISYIQTTEGAMDEVSDMLNRIYELAEQAANGTNEADDLTAIGSEVEQLLEEIGRIKSSTKFNGIDCFSDTQTVSIQVGTGSSDQIVIEAATFDEGAITAANISAGGDDAKDELAVIKSVITAVTEERSTLGAMQNRLEHTMKNLSVTEENLTNAESAIRDTDVAEEMMAYTKNNILIQSAQAMLAQANQVPQGVLQLLQ